MRGIKKFLIGDINSYLRIRALLTKICFESCIIVEFADPVGTPDTEHEYFFPKSSNV